MSTAATLDLAAECFQLKPDVRVMCAAMQRGADIFAPIVRVPSVIDTELPAVMAQARAVLERLPGLQTSQREAGRALLPLSLKEGSGLFDINFRVALARDQYACWEPGNQWMRPEVAVTTPFAMLSQRWGQDEALSRRRVLEAYVLRRGQCCEVPMAFWRKQPDGSYVGTDAIELVLYSAHRDDAQIFDPHSVDVHRCATAAVQVAVDVALGRLCPVARDEGEGHVQDVARRWTTHAAGLPWLDKAIELFELGAAPSRDWWMGAQSGRPRWYSFEHEGVKCPFNHVVARRRSGTSFVAALEALQKVGMPIDEPDGIGRLLPHVHVAQEWHVEGAVTAVMGMERLGLNLEQRDERKRLPTAYLHRSLRDLRPVFAALKANRALADPTRAALVAPL